MIVMTGRGHLTNGEQNCVHRVLQVIPHWHVKRIACVQGKFFSTLEEAQIDAKRSLTQLLSAFSWAVSCLQKRRLWLRLEPGSSELWIGVGETLELLLVDGLDDFSIDDSQCRLLFSELGVEVASISNAFLHVTTEFTWWKYNKCTNGKSTGQWNQENSTSNEYRTLAWKQRDWQSNKLYNSKHQKYKEHFTASHQC